MKSDHKKLIQLIDNNEKFSLFFKVMIIILFLVLVSAFAVSITYSMVMEENFYRNNKVSKAQTEYKKDFLVVMYQNSNDFLSRFQRSIIEEAEKKKIRIDFVNVESIGEAIDAINTAVAAKVDGIIAQGIYDADYIHAINQAKDKGIVVQFVYTDARGTARDYFIGYNPYDHGKLVARCVIDEMPGRLSNVALMVHSVTDVEKDVTGSLTIEGFKSVIDKHPTIKIADIVHTSYDLFSAEDAAYDILTRYPDIDAIICTSEKDTFGVVQVIIDMNRVGKTKVIGAGVSKDILKYIELEVIAASFDMNPEIMGEKSLNIMLGEKAASDFAEIPITTVKADNVHFFNK